MDMDSRFMNITLHYYKSIGTTDIWTPGSTTGNYSLYTFARYREGSACAPAVLSSLALDFVLLRGVCVCGQKIGSV